MSQHTHIYRWNWCHTPADNVLREFRSTRKVKPRKDVGSPAFDSRVMCQNGAGELFPVSVEGRPEGPGCTSVRTGLHDREYLTTDGNDVWKLLGYALTGELVLLGIGTRDDSPQDHYRLMPDKRGEYIVIPYVNVVKGHGTIADLDDIPHIPRTTLDKDLVGKRFADIRGHVVEVVSVMDFADGTYMVEVKRHLTNGEAFMDSMDMREFRASYGPAHAVQHARFPSNQVGSYVDERQWLYRFFNDDGVLLYVGISVNVFSRWKAHAYEKPWMDEVTTFTRKEYPSREAVEAAEIKAIRREKPIYNVTYNVARVAS